MAVTPTTLEAGRAFFTVGGTLPANAPSYIVREADTDLATHLLSGDFCYVLTSRQMGKSSLMVQTAVRLRREGMRVAVLDLTKIGQNLSPEQWYDGLLLRLGQEFGLEDEVDDFWTSSDEAVRRMGPMQRCMSALRQVILPAIPGKVAIFVDEIDAVRGLPFSTDEFFAGIRELYNSRTVDPELYRVTLCLLGVATPSDLIRNVSTTPFNIGYRVQLADFSPREAAPLVQGLGKTPATGIRLLQRILWWTGGHPYLTQRLCAAVAADPEVTSTRQVDHLCNRLFLSSRARETDDNLLFVRERVLRSEADRTSLLDLYERIRGGKRVPDDDANPLIDVLRLAGLIAVRDNRLVVRNRIYSYVFDQRWINVNMPDEELRRQRAAFRKGMIRAAGLAVVVFAVIGWFAFQDLARRQVFQIRRYCTLTIQTQQAFDNGNYSAGFNLFRQMGALERSPEGAVGERFLRRLPLPHWFLPWVFRHPKLAALLDLFDGKVDPAFEYAYLVARAGGDSALQYVGHLGEVRGVAISPDGYWLASAGADSTVRVFDIRDLSAEQHQDHLPLTRALLVFTSDRGAGSTETIQPNGDQNWSVNAELRDRLSRQLSSTAEPRRTQLENDLQQNLPNYLRRRLPGVLSVKFSPDGNWIAVATGKWPSQGAGTVYLWSTKPPYTVLTLPDQPRQTKAVDAVAFKNETEFASTSEDNTAEFWKIVPKEGVKPDGDPFDGGCADTNGMETASCSPLLKAGLPPPSGGLNAAAYSPDGRTFAMGFGDGHLWIEGRTRPILADVSGLMSLAFYDNNLLLLGTRDGRVLIYDLRASDPTETQVLMETGQGQVTSLTISPDPYRRDLADAKLPKILVTTGSSGTVRIWSLVPENDRLSAMDDGMLRGHRDVTYSAAVSPGQQVIVSGGADNRVRFWLNDPQKHSTWSSQPLAVAASGAVKAVAYSPDGHRFASLRGASAAADEAKPADIAISEIDDCTGKPRRTVTLNGHASAGTALAWSLDGKHVATSGQGGMVLVWDAEAALKEPPKTGATLELHSVNEPLDSPDPEHPFPVLALAYFSYGNQEYLAGAGNASTAFKWSGHTFAGTGTIVLWKPADSRAIQHIVQPAELEGEPAANLSVTTLAVSSGGRWLALCGSDNMVQIWDIPSLFQNSPESVQLVRNRKATYSRLPEIRFLDGAETPDKPHHPAFEGRCNALAFSPDGQWLAAGTTQNEIAVWSTGDWQRVEGDLSGFSKSPIDPGVPPTYLDAPPKAMARVNAIAFSSDSRRLAYGTADSKIELWDVYDRQPLSTIAAHTRGVLTLAFSPLSPEYQQECHVSAPPPSDSLCIASGGNDRTLRFSCEINPRRAAAIRNQFPKDKDPGITRAEANDWLPFLQ